MSTCMPIISLAAKLRPRNVKTKEIISNLCEEMISNFFCFTPLKAKAKIDIKMYQVWHICFFFFLKNRKNIRIEGKML